MASTAAGRRYGWRARWNSLFRFSAVGMAGTVLYGCADRDWREAATEAATELHDDARGTPRSEPSGPPPAPPNDAPDGCSDRVVSRIKPCSNDPDPCGLNSGWAGDEYCLLPPPAGAGIQIHFGPKSYTDKAETDRYVINPNEEFSNSVLAHVPLTADEYFHRVTVHARPGTHHWISSSVAGQPSEGFYANTSCGAEFAGVSLGRGQNLIYDDPPQGIAAPENEGLGRRIAGNSSECMALHAYNFTDRPQLRELWANIYFIDESAITQRAGSIGMVGALGLNLAAGESLELTYQGRFASDGRIIQLFGQRHVWTPRLAAWLNDELIYDSHDWLEAATFNYDSLTMNPPIDTAAQRDGAVSGIVAFEAGDTLKYSCFIDNFSDHVLRFGDDLEGHEMCNLFGGTVGGSLSGRFQ